MSLIKWKFIVLKKPQFSGPFFFLNMSEMATMVNSEKWEEIAPMK